MSESTVNPEASRRFSPLEAARNVVEKVRSTITDKKKLALVTAGTGLVFLNACGTYTEATTDSRQATVLEVQPIEISGLQSEQLDFVQKEKDRVINVLRDFVNDDILNHYNAVNLEANPALIKQQQDYLQRYGGTNWEGILYPKGKENTLLGLGGNKNNSFGSGENVPFALGVDNKRNISIFLRPYQSPYFRGVDTQGKQTHLSDPNAQYVRGFIPELDRLATWQGSDKIVGTIPLIGREIAARRILKIPNDANFEPGLKDRDYSNSPLTWNYELPDGRQVQGLMNADSSIQVKVATPQRNP